MSNLKDILKKSQGSEKMNFPKLEPDIRLTLKENEKGQPAFCIYNKEKHENEYTTKPITGIFIGYAMMIGGYSDDLGLRGGNYRSELYPSKTCNISLFQPTKSGFEVCKKGSIDEIINYLKDNAKGGMVKRVLILLIQTDKAFIAIETNMTIGFDYLFRLNKEELLLSHKIKLTPALYDKEDDNISYKAKEVLGKFANKNKPRYVHIDVDKEIDENSDIAQLAAESAEKFLIWKEFKMKGGVIEEKKEETQTTTLSEPITKEDDVSEEISTDDLPF